MKKILAFVLAAAMISAASVAGTIAYLTDEETAINIMTLGNVQITLNEKDRNDNPFKQNQKLLPAIDPNGDEDYYDAENYIDKIVTVTNNGTEAAYIRTFIAIPKITVGGQTTEDVLHWEKYDGNDNNWTWETPFDAAINGTDYLVYVVTLNEELDAKETTVPNLIGLYLDPLVDYNGSNYTYSGDIVSGLSANMQILVAAQAVQAEGWGDKSDDALNTAFYTPDADNHPWVDTTIVNVSSDEALAAAIENIKTDEPVIIALAAGEYTTNFAIPGGSDVTITGSEDAVLSGQIASTSSTAGTVTLRGVTVKVDNSLNDSTGISQTKKSAIALWGNQTVICEGVTFDMSLSDSTAITSWWDTNEGTTIICRNCTFNCNGQRPIRATGNVTVENCEFNDPYRYAVQLTAKADTATELDKAVVNFNNNTIIDGASGKAFVYGIQLEGADYGCNDLVINGTGNTIKNGGDGSTMYYCECGKVDHSTVVFNTEVAPVHEG